MKRNAVQMWKSMLRRDVQWRPARLRELAYATRKEDKTVEQHPSSDEDCKWREHVQTEKCRTEKRRGER